MKSLAWLGALCAVVIAAPMALADGTLVGPPGLADAPSARDVLVPAALPVVRHDALRLRAEVPYSMAEGILVGGPCDTPCATPCARPAPAPCGVCREGFNACGQPKWGFSLWIGSWIWGQDGTLGTAAGDFDVDTTPSDSIDIAKDYLEGVLTGGFRVTYGRWFLRAAESYMRLGQDSTLPSGEPIDVTAKALTVEAVVGYRVLEVPLGCGPCSTCLAIEPFVGARYNGVTLAVDRRQGTSDKSENWVDPILGCDFRFDFRNKWWAHVGLDVGGFGIGSDVTWGARCDVGYMFTRHFGMFVGFTALSWDYEEGTFRYDIVQYGPTMGFVFKF